MEKDDAYGDDPRPDEWGAADVPRRGGEEDPEQAPDAPYQGDPPPDPTSPPGAEALGEERDKDAPVARPHTPPWTKGDAKGGGGDEDPQAPGIPTPLHQDPVPEDNPDPEPRY